MSKLQKLLTSAVVVGVLGSLVALGVFGLFSATTQNSGNEISAGTVVLSDNDAGSAMFNITGSKPGETWSRCIKLSYNGTLPADIRTYEAGGTGPLAPYIHLVVEQGTQSGGTFPNCTGFVSDGAPPSYEGPAFDTKSLDFATGVPINPIGQTFWNPGDSVVFKINMTLESNAPESIQGTTTGPFTYIFEARNH